MARELIAGSILNQIAGSDIRYPAHQVIIWNPRVVKIGDIASGQLKEAGIDITPWVQSLIYRENIGFENGDDPTVTSAEFSFRRNSLAGVDIRRGWIEDGVIVQIRTGDRRVARSEWVPVFTGTFRGRPGDDPGTPADQTEGLTAVAFGREERYLNLQVTTTAFDSGTDVGEMAAVVAQNHMGLGQDEILFGVQDFIAPHEVNQIVEINALQSLWELFFPVGKKPKFDSIGRLRAVDVRFDKPPVRVYSSGNLMVRRLSAAPNDVEVNNSVVLRGMNSEMTKSVQDGRLLTEVGATTGFFDSSFDERIYYSQDRTQRAQETFLVTRKRIQWSEASWVEVDEFSGVLSIDTKYLRNARVIIFITYLVTMIAVSALDFIMFAGGTTVANAPVPGLGITVATLREILFVLSQVALAGLLWAMQFVGRGQYEIHGKPFEFVYQQLAVRHQLVGLDPEEVREIEFRNDMIDDLLELDARAKELLRRELVKNQLYAVELLDDPLLEVDDVIETADGDRFYIVSTERSVKDSEEPILKLTCWKIADGRLAPVEAATAGATA